MNHTAMYRWIARGVWAALLLLACSAHPVLADAPSGAAVTIAVTDPAGRPLAGAFVTLELAGVSTTPVARAKTGDDGRAEVTVRDPARAVDLIVRPPAALWPDLGDARKRRWKPQDETVGLPRALSIRGRVVGPGGKPAPHVRIEFDRAPKARSFDDSPSVVTRPNGAFVIGRLPPGTIQLRRPEDRFANPPPKVESWPVEAGRQDVVLRLAAVPRAQAAYRLHVFTAYGEPVHGGNAGNSSHHMGRRGNIVSSGGSSGYGSFEGGVEIDVNVHAAQYFEISCPNDITGNALPFGPAILGPIGPGPRAVEVHLPLGRRLHGHVVDGGGQGVPGVGVSAIPARKTRAFGLEPKMEWVTHPVHGKAKTGPDGRFALVSLGDEEYRLHFDPPETHSPHPPVHARVGSDGPVVTLKAAVTVTVTIHDWSGRPLAKVDVEVEQPIEGDRMGPNSTQRRGHTDEAGRVVLRGLDPAKRYELKVTFPGVVRTHVDGESTLEYPAFEARDTVIEHWVPKSETITLERGYLISGVANDPLGRPIPYAEIHFQREGANWTTMHHADEKGAFVLGELHKSRYRIYSCLPNPADLPEAHRRDPATGAPLPSTPEGGQQRAARVQREFTKHAIFIEAPAENVDLPVSVPSDLGIHVTGWSKRYRGVKAVLLREGGDAETDRIEKPVGRTGLVMFDRLDWKATYTLWIGPVGKGLYVLRKGLRVEKGDVQLALQEGRKVKGKVLGTKGLRSKKVWIVLPSGIRLEGKVQLTGRFEIKGVPPGTWPIHASARSGTDLREGKAEVEAGGTVEIALGT